MATFTRRAPARVRTVEELGYTVVSSSRAWDSRVADELTLQRPDGEVSCWARTQDIVLSREADSGFIVRHGLGTYFCWKGKTIDPREVGK